MNKKYEFTDETIEIDGHILHRIRSLMDFSIVHKGDIGGFIEKEGNLSYGDDDSWVYNDAHVFGDARVYGDADVYNDAVVFGNARVFGNSDVFHNAQVSGDAWVFGNTRVYDDAVISGNAQVSGDARVFRNAQVFNSSRINKLSDIGRNAIIESNDDFYTIENIGSRNDNITFYRTKDSIYVSCGCFNDSIDEFERRVKEVHHDTKYEKQYLATITFAKTLLSKDS